MLLAFIIYFIDVLSNNGAPAVLGAIFLFSFYLIAFLSTDGFDDSERATNSEKNSYRIFKTSRPWVLTACITAILYGTLIPNKETTYKMLAAYGVTELVTSEAVQKYASGSLKVLEKAMSEYIGDDWNTEDTTKETNNL